LVVLNLFRRDRDSSERSVAPSGFGGLAVKRSHEGGELMGMLGHTKRRTITAATAVIALGLLSFGGGMAANAAVPAGNAVVYDATVTPLPGNLPSQPFQAQQTAEFGDLVQLAGTNRVLRSATVTMSDWAKASDYPSLPAAGWTHPITFNVYNVNNAGTEPAPGLLIGSVTQTKTIPWRPEADPTNCGTGSTAWYSTADAKCYNGFAFNVTFDLSSIGTVPDKIIYGIAYNTNTWGYDPIGLPGPYESLNVGLNTASPTTGIDVESDAVFWNTKTAGWYADGGTGGVGTFRRDTNWAPYVPAVSLTAWSVSGDCSFSESGDTITLLGDCTTDQTILVPDGKTLDGNGHSITAVDPTGGHFLGAVVQNDGATASVTNLTVTANNLTTACDAFPDSLAGIRLDGATGSITNNTVTGLQQGASGDGCQEGNAIEVRNTIGTGTPQVTVTGNVVSAYQKTGVLVKGQVAAIVTGNTVLGYGPVGFIAQNGIQVSLGATAQVTSNSISDNFYTPESYDACGLIIYHAGGVKLGKNIFAGNEKNVCNIGRGGGKFGDA